MLPEPSRMKPYAQFLLLVALSGWALVGCGTLSEDPAPGGIKASETGMNVQTIRDWQDQTVRRLAY